MAIPTKLLGFFSLVPVEFSPIRAVRVMATYTSKSPSRPTGVFNASHRMTLLGTPAPFAFNQCIQGRRRMGPVENITVALSAGLVCIMFQEFFERRRMYTMALKALAVGNRLVDVFPFEPVSRVARIAQIGNIACQKLGIRALM